MRTVVYFSDGTVADFVVSDENFDNFSKNIAYDRRYDDVQLDRARQVLTRFMMNPEAESGALEEASACFIWNYFNTHPKEASRICDDVLIIDLKGDGRQIEFAGLSEVELAQEET